MSLHPNEVLLAPVFRSKLPDAERLSIPQLVRDLAAAARAIAPFFERYDAWVTPRLARPPDALGILNQSQGGAVEYWRFDCAFNPWNPIANVTGQPAVSLPLSWTADGLPIGSLIFGRFGDEATLLRLAGQLEAARPWADRWPPVSIAAAPRMMSGA